MFNNLNKHNLTNLSDIKWCHYYYKIRIDFYLIFIYKLFIEIKTLIIV